MTFLSSGAKRLETTQARLQAYIENVLSDIVDPDSPFSLLDFPNYSNIGDSAIYFGELCYFSRRNMRPSYVSTTNNFDPVEMDARTHGGAIYLQGGGNFGDIWPWFQPFREGILERFKGRKVVQLPQTIFYSSQKELDRTARVIEKHGAFTLLVRDQRSFDLATKSFQCTVRLCPDMAFCIGSIDRPSAPSYELLLHLRNDKEAASLHDISKLSQTPGILHADWPNEGPRRNKYFNVRAGLGVIPTAITKGGIAFREARYRKLAEARLARGVRLLGNAKAVITDRLHGHIISSLMGMPHAVLDNSYGKTSGFMDAWETAEEHSYLASSLDEALEILRTKENLKIA